MALAARLGELQKREPFFQNPSKTTQETIKLTLNFNQLFRLQVLAVDRIALIFNDVLLNQPLLEDGPGPG